jgi:hypothetical protein
MGSRRASQLRKCYHSRPAGKIADRIDRFSGASTNSIDLHYN